MAVRDVVVMAVGKMAETQVDSSGYRSRANLMSELHVTMILVLGASVMGVVRWMTDSSSSMVAASVALAFGIAVLEAIVGDNVGRWRGLM